MENGLYLFAGIEMAVPGADLFPVGLEPLSEGFEADPIKVCQLFGGIRFGCAVLL